MTYFVFRSEDGRFKRIGEITIAKRIARDAQKLAQAAKSAFPQAKGDLHVFDHPRPRAHVPYNPFIGDVVYGRGLDADVWGGDGVTIE